MKEVHLCVRVWAPIDMSESDVCNYVQDCMDHELDRRPEVLKDAEVYLDEVEDE